MHRLRRLVVVAVALSSVLPSAARAAADGDRVAEHTRRSTTVVTARVTPDSEAVGAGVILAVSPNVIVLTAGHLAARKNLAVRTFAGEQLHIVAEYPVADRDLALIVASGPCTGCEAAETAGSILTGAPIHVWGNPFGRRYVESSGTIADLHPAIPGFATNGRFALACDTCDVGDSGAGVFDERGRLLGIVTEGWEGGKGPKRVIAEPANHALAGVPLEYLARTDTAAPPQQPVGQNAVQLTCGDSRVVSIGMSLVLSARLAGRAISDAELKREAERAGREAARECAASARATW